MSAPVVDVHDAFCLHALPEGSVVLPAACFLRESQKVSLAGFRVE